MTLYRRCRRCKADKSPSVKRLCEACRPVAETRIRRYVACRICGRDKVRDAQDTCARCRPRVYRNRAEWRRRRLDTVLTHYGGKCACCGETEREFLHIDHVDGGGKAHRRALGGNRIEAWLLRHGLPEGFRVLCANCNLALGRLGFCPHNPAVKTEAKVIPLRRET